MRVYKWLYVAEYLETQTFPGRDNEAIDMVMKHVDDMLLANDMQGVSDVLKIAAEHIDSAQVLLTLLTMTHGIPQFNAWEGSESLRVYQKVRRKLVRVYENEGLSPDEIQNMLVGL